MVIESDSKILLLALQGKGVERPPFWFMRQAGRYLPEYRELRSRHKNFLQFCYTPEAACEATLQPIRRFGMDGAIIFSDILVIPDALGAEVGFEEGRGPVLSPIRNSEQLTRLSASGLSEKLAPVYEALALTRKNLPEETTLIGFVGAPWTIACYMIEGGTSKDFAQVKSLASEQKEFFTSLIDLLTGSIITHAKNQIRAGAETIQIFDSWAGIVDDQAFKQWVIAPTRKIVAGIKTEFPQVPIIGFPRQAGERYLAYAEETGVDAVSFDASVPLAWAKNNLQGKVMVQGSLNPMLLADDKAAALAEAKEIVATLGDKVFVFNLGHGILPQTPVENLQAICDYLKTVRFT
jgi:uroporphyrinogen decarboxylase